MTRQYIDEGFAENPAENYERFFVPAIGKPLAIDLVRRAELRPGERVLDVACGTGIVTRLAAREIGSGGETTGLDTNRGMLQVARAAMPTDVPAEWQEAEAEKMPLDDGSFDVVFCQMGLQFMEDKAKGLEEMHRVLTDGGRAVLSLPGPIPPLFEIFAEAMGRYIGPEPNGFVRAVFALHDIEEVRALLSDTGFRDSIVEAETKTLRLPAPRDFLWQYIHSTPLHGFVEGADEETLAVLTEDVVSQWSEHEEKGGIRFELRVVEAIGRK